MAASGDIRLTRDAKENHARPAIDPLFRSAAIAHGTRTIGVILSGRLDDGTAGLQAIQACGGLTVVQDPEDAEESQIHLQVEALHQLHRRSAVDAPDGLNATASQGRYLGYCTL